MKYKYSVPPKKVKIIWLKCIKDDNNLKVGDITWHVDTSSYFTDGKPNWNTLHFEKNKNCINYSSKNFIVVNGPEDELTYEIY